MLNVKLTDLTHVDRPFVRLSAASVITTRIGTVVHGADIVAPGMHSVPSCDDLLYMVREHGYVLVSDDWKIEVS